MRRAVAMIFAVALLLVACTSAEDSGSQTATAGEAAADTDEASFCTLWPDMKALNEAEDPPDREHIDSYLEISDEIAGQVPAELTDEWAVLVEWNDHLLEIAYAVEFEWEVVDEQVVAQAFGSVEEAEAAEVAQQTAAASIDRWALQNCGETAADAYAFCDLWDDIYPRLRGLYPDPNMNPASAEAKNELADMIAEADGVAPEDVREYWDPVASYYLTWHDLMLTVDFDESLINDDLLTDAFGSPAAAEAAATEAAAAVESVEAWSVTGCGDWCARSRELMEASGELGDDLGWANDDPYRFEQRLRSVAHNEAIIPDELRIFWDPVYAALKDWIDWWESHGADIQSAEEGSPIHAEAMEIYRQASYYSLLPEPADPNNAEWVRAVDAWRAGGELSDEINQPLRLLIMAPLHERPGWAWASGEIDQWSRDNCTGTTGGAGIVEVRFGEVTQAAGDHLVVVAGPPGSTAADLSSPEHFLVGMCHPIDRDPWGVVDYDTGDGQSEIQHSGGSLRTRLHEEEQNHLCAWHGEHSVLNPGPYTLVAARYDGASPRPNVDVEPTHCLTMDFTVAGDTLLDLTDIPACASAEQPPGPGEWGYVEPVDASAPGAGTLKLRIPSHISPEHTQVDGDGRFSVQVMVLPGGTTLNDVGRESVFPVAAGCTWLLRTEDLPGDVESLPVEIPLGSLPAVGLQQCLDASWLNGTQPIPGAPPGDPPDDSKLPLTTLATGIYDMYVRGFWDGWEHEGMCISFEVVVEGDTVIDLPIEPENLEPC